MSAPNQNGLYYVAYETCQNFSPIPPSRLCPHPADVPYYITREGVQDIYITPYVVVRVGDIVTVNLDEGVEGYAKTSEMRRLNNVRYGVIYTWLYTREGVEPELQIGSLLSKEFRKSLDRWWPTNAPYRYMFSANRTVTLWDTAISQAPEEAITKICYSSIYSTTTFTRWVWSVDDTRFRWMKRIVKLDAPILRCGRGTGRGNEVNEDCLVF